MMIVNETVAFALAEQVMEADRQKYLTPRILGYGLELFMLGVMMAQLCYWASHFRDNGWVRLTVHVSTIMSFAMSIHNIVWTSVSFANNYGTYHTFEQLWWFPTCHLLDMLCIVPIQLFYLHRAYVINKRAKWIPVVTIPLIILSAAASVAALVVWGVMDSVNQFNLVKSKIIVCVQLWLASTVAVDVLLTVLICYGLWRSRTGWNETDRVIVRLLKFSVETQLPGAILAIILLLCLTVTPMGFLVPLFVLLHPKTYCIALLAVLNYRTNLRSDMNNTQLTTLKRSQGESRTDALVDADLDKGLSSPSVRSPTKTDYYFTASALGSEQTSRI